MNPFLEDGESTHVYNGQAFVVDYYPDCDMWQCSDGRHFVRGSGNTKAEAIQSAHEQWDAYIHENPELIQR